MENERGNTETECGNPIAISIGRDVIAGRAGHSNNATTEWIQGSYSYNGTLSRLNYPILLKQL